MYSIMLVKHRRHLDGLCNDRGNDGDQDTDLLAAEVATNAVIANLNRAKSQDFVAYQWGHVWYVGRIVGAYQPYDDDLRYVRLLSDPNDVPDEVENVLRSTQSFRVVMTNGNHVVRYLTLSEDGILRTQ